MATIIGCRAGRRQSLSAPLHKDHLFAVQALLAAGAPWDPYLGRAGRLRRPGPRRVVASTADGGFARTGCAQSLLERTRAQTLHVKVTSDMTGASVAKAAMEVVATGPLPLPSDTKWTTIGRAAALSLARMTSYGSPSTSSPLTRDT
jgi:hypothetical protein